MAQNDCPNNTDSASWAALVIAIFAMLIAIGQITQQYASSGQLIRLCDSVVYGGDSGLPGKGHRVWTWTQFRFRVLYEVPVFGFPLSSRPLWMAPTISSAQVGAEYESALLSLRKNASAVSSNEQYWSVLSTEHQVGEASWVSFCRKIKSPCTDRVLIILKDGDADRYAIKFKLLD